MTASAATALLAVFAALAAWLDLTQRRLPNWLSLATAAAGLTVAISEGGLGALGWHLAHGLLVLAIGMELFRRAIIGGGDAKFWAACAAWFPLREAPHLLFAVSFAGLVLIGGWFAVRQVARAHFESQRGHFARVPFGIAIAGGAIAARTMLA